MAKRSIAIAGHRTSISLEEPFWRSLAEIAAARGASLSAVVAEIDRERPAGANLSSAIRIAVLQWYRARAAVAAIAAAPARPPSGRPPAAGSGG